MESKDADHSSSSLLGAGDAKPAPPSSSVKTEVCLETYFVVHSIKAVCILYLVKHSVTWSTYLNRLFYNLLQFIIVIFLFINEILLFLLYLLF